MALIATSLARSERLAGGALVATIMSNLGLELTGRGIGLHRTAVGDRYVVEKMRISTATSAASSRVTCATGQGHPINRLAELLPWSWQRPADRTE